MSVNCCSMCFSFGQKFISITRPISYFSSSIFFHIFAVVSLFPCQPALSICRYIIVPYDISRSLSVNCCSMRFSVEQKFTSITRSIFYFSSKVSFLASTTTTLSTFCTIRVPDNYNLCTISTSISNCLEILSASSFLWTMLAYRFIWPLCSALNGTCRISILYWPLNICSNFRRSVPRSMSTSTVHLQVYNSALRYI